MAGRKYLILFTLMLFASLLKAQDKNVAQADSISERLYLAGDWHKLIQYGNEQLSAGTDFTILRQRVAYACFVTEDYKGAQVQYNHILSNDNYNITARYYSYYCNIYLNNTRAAGVDASYLDSATLKKEGVGKYDLLSLGAEISAKFPKSQYRDNGLYSRLGLRNRIGWRFQLEQSVAYFNQNIYPAAITSGPGGTANTNQAANPDNQFEYYIKGSYSLSNKVALIGAYHYLNTGYLNTSYNNNVGFAGINYTGSRYFDLQADVSFGSIFSAHTMQYSGQLTWYPKGNLNLYTISRASEKTTGSKNNFVFNQAVGFKIARKTWLEGSITLGDLENYADADGLYIYNAIDNTTFKSGATLFYQLNLHTMLQLNYTYETKYDIYRTVNYAQHSIAAGIVWKF